MIIVNAFGTSFVDDSLSEIPKGRLHSPIV